MAGAERLTPERTALVLLAAGRSQRFGAGDKLAAPLLGVPLGLHVATALAAVPFGKRIAVCGAQPLDYAALGYDVVVNPDPAVGQSGSVRLGVAAARGHDAVLLALADMPCVTAAHVQRLFDVAEGAETMVASSDGTRASPPALFGVAHFETLTALTGDQGARTLIRAAQQVVAPADELIDIDTEADLAALRRRLEPATE